MYLVLLSWFDSIFIASSGNEHTHQETPPTNPSHQETPPTNPSHQETPPTNPSHHAGFLPISAVDSTCKLIHSSKQLSVLSYLKMYL